jgi:hypothetical protein
MAPIRKVSNENTRLPENQKVLIFRHSLKKKTYGRNLSPPRLAHNPSSPDFAGPCQHVAHATRAGVHLKRLLAIELPFY